jgi:2-polyprenyl-3-methyl-5-hydroxy-6-metoxy-1,4-benzoquinol methylase
MSDLYSNYWKRKEILKTQIPHFPVLKFFISSGLSPIEKKYWSVVKDAQSILDFGAGDLWMMKKLQAHGYKGVYETLDVADGFDYTYKTLDQVKKKFDVIICLDVLEHMPLNDGLGLLQGLVALLNKGGTLILQTPNARCIRHPLSWDMTHVHCYNLPDLWAYLSSMDLKVEGMRVVFTPEKIGFWKKLQNLIGQIIITKFLGSDYADNIALLARK